MMKNMMPEDGPPDGHDGHSGRDDSRCSSVADDCCACDKSIGQLTCDFDEPATCRDGYVAMIPPGEDYEGSCQYSCYPPDHGGYYYHGLDCSTMTYCEGITETKGEPFYCYSCNCKDYDEKEGDLLMSQCLAGTPAPPKRKLDGHTAHKDCALCPSGEGCLQGCTSGDSPCTDFSVCSALSKEG